MAIGEFAEIGNTVREFASDEAVVVVGTVLDDELSDELRVTVVATGIGERAVQREEPPMQLVQKTDEVETSEAVNYKDLDRPTVIRQQRVVGENFSTPMDADLDYLDVPAFLRRQAD
jgi:cell division protein FtsZ